MEFLDITRSSNLMRLPSGNPAASEAHLYLPALIEDRWMMGASGADDIVPSARVQKLLSLVIAHKTCGRGLASSIKRSGNGAYFADFFFEISSSLERIAFTSASSAPKVDSSILRASRNSCWDAAKSPI